MASSVSSERSFSSAGLTITKRRNRLGYDIVEALQILKSAIREDMLFAPPEPSKAQELLLEENEQTDEEDEENEQGANNDELDIIVMDGECI